VESITGKVRKKVEKYSNYLRNTSTLQVIQANVHLILSEDTQNNSEADIRCWDQLTTKPVLIYNGFGSHRSMFSPGPLEKNVDLIKKILDK
jgi:thioesterase domain-containing protein